MTAPRTLLIATQNRGKLLELETMLSSLPYRLSSLADYPHLSPIAETGETFRDNACLKACGYAQQTQMLTLADDSGLEVDALGGAPGVHSARYAGEGASDVARTTKLLRAMSAYSGEDRTARFVSVIAISSPEGLIMHTATGVCAGKLAVSPSGPGGFGYDPIFIPNGYEQTFGALPAGVKNQISHRALALRQAQDFLRFLTDSSTAS